MLIQTDKIDLVTLEKDSNRYKLHLVIEEKELYDYDKFNAYLLEKLNNYAIYFLDGQMREQYTDLDQPTITVLIQSMNQVNLKELTYMSKLAGEFRNHSLEILYERL